MFRWVQMSLEALSVHQLPRGFEDALGQLPVELSRLYDVIYAQIDQTARYERSVAIKTLSWLLCAQRLLTVNELLTAVDALDQASSLSSSSLIASSSSSFEGEEDDRYDQVSSRTNSVLQLCRNLVVLDLEEGTFRFAHASVREYLLQKPDFTIIEQHTQAVEGCLDVCIAEWPSDLENSRKPGKRSPFKSYAEIYWPVHYKYVYDAPSQQTEERVLHFCLEGSETSPIYHRWASDLWSKFENLPVHNWDNLAARANKILSLDRGDRLGVKLYCAVSGPISYLNIACAFGFPGLLDNYTASNVNVSGPRDQDTCLVIAAQEGHSRIVQTLLEKGADINARNADEEVALHRASSQGHQGIVQMLLEKGANVNARNASGDAALQRASSEGHQGIVQVLLENGADVNARNSNGEAALHWATSRGHQGIVQILVDKGMDIDMQDNLGGTALLAAAFGGNRESLEFLIRNGANINMQNEDQYSVLHMAMEGGGDAGLVCFLLENGANVDIQDLKGLTALHLASEYGNHGIMRVLLEYGADVNIQDLEGCTALHLALRYSDQDVAHFMIENGADINIQDLEGRTALHLASRYNNQDVVHFMIENGADVNIQDLKGRTALHLASRYNNQGIVRILLENDANIDVLSE